MAKLKLLEYKMKRIQQLKSLIDIRSTRKVYMLNHTSYSKFKLPRDKYFGSTLTVKVVEFVEHVVDGLRSDKSLSGVENPSPQQEVHPAGHVST